MRSFTLGLAGCLLLTLAITPFAAATGPSKCGAIDIACQMVCVDEPQDGTGAVGCIMTHWGILHVLVPNWTYIANCLYDLTLPPLDNCGLP